LMPLPLRAPVRLQVEIGASQNKAMQRLSRRHDLEAVSHPLFVATDKRAADAGEPVFYSSADWEIAVRVLEIMRVTDVIHKYPGQERVDLPISERAILRPQRSNELWVVVGRAVSAVLMISKRDMALRLPA